MHQLRRREQQIEALVCFERPCVKHDGRRRTQAERLPDLCTGACDRRVAGARRILDQDRARPWHDLPGDFFQMRTDHDRHARAPDGGAFEALKKPAQHGRAAERKILELLRQAGMHVVEMRHAQRRRNQHADGGALFVRMNHVIARTARPIQRRHRQRQIQKQLRGRRPDLHARHEGRPRRAENVQSGQFDVPAKWIGDEIHRVAKIEERANPVVFAERRAPRLEKRLRGDHQNVHQDTAIVGNASANVKHDRRHPTDQ